MTLNITIRGTVAKKRELTEYAHRVLNHFFKGKLRRVVNIDIHVCKEVIDEDGVSHGGVCWGDKSNVYIMISKGLTEYDDVGHAEYGRYSFDDVVELLTHELTHAKQFIRGEINSSNAIWKGKNGPIDCKKVAYPKQPWEKEAFYFETVLKKQYWMKDDAQ